MARKLLAIVLLGMLAGWAQHTYAANARLQGSTNTASKVTIQSEPTTSYLQPARQSPTINVTNNALLEAHNVQRAVVGAQPLRLNGNLIDSADMKCKDMQAYGYWAHDNPVTSENPWVWFTRSGYLYEKAGENLSKDYYNVDTVMQAWLNSPAHRNTMLNPVFNEVGFATCNRMVGSDADYLVVAHFGKSIY